MTSTGPELVQPTSADRQQDPLTGAGHALEPFLRWFWWLGSAAGLVGIAWVLLCIPILPTHDGPQHIYAAWLLNHWSEMAWVHPLLELNGGRITSYGFDLIFRPLESFLPWRLATQLTLAIIATTFASGVIAATSAATPNQRVRTFTWFALPAAIPWMMYMGYFNYLAGLALCGWALYLAIRLVKAHESGKARARDMFAGGLAALMLVQAVAHSFAAVVTGLLLFFLGSAAALGARSWRLLFCFAPAAVPVAVISWLTTRGVANTDLAVNVLDSAQRMDLATSTLAGGSAPGSFFLLGVAVSGGVAGIVGGRQAWARGLGVAALIMAAIYAFAPFDIPGWQVFAPRWGVPAVVAGVIAFSGGLRRSWRRPNVTLPLFAAIVVGFWIFQTGKLHRTLDQECGPALAPLDLPTNQRIAFIGERTCGEQYAHTIPLARWLANADVYHAIDNNGLPDLYTGYASIHAFTPAADSGIHLLSDWAALDVGKLTPDAIGTLSGPPTDQPRPWLEITAYLASEMAMRDVTVLFGDNNDPAHLLDRGFAHTSPRTGVQVATFEGCRAFVAPATPPTSSLVMHARFFPDSTWHPMPAPELQPDGTFAITVPCGPVALRIFDDTDGNGLAGDADLYCADQPGEQELLRLIPPGTTPRVGCSFQ
jgi:hypothetical protein